MLPKTIKAEHLTIDGFSYFSEKRNVAPAISGANLQIRNVGCG